MDKIILIGGGGNSKKIIDILIENGYYIQGILDDKYNNIIEYYRNIKIIDKISNINNYKNCKFVVTIGDMNFRKSFFSKYSNLNYINVINKKSYISPTVCLGKGIIIHHGVNIGPDVIIGDFSHIDTNGNIEHDTIMGSNCLICPGVIICGHSTIKNNVFVGAGTVVINSTNSKKIIIDDDVIVGAGSIITKSITKNMLYYGNPLNYRSRNI